MLNDRNDFPLSLPRRLIRSALFRVGLTRRLGHWRWRLVEEAPYIHLVYRRSSTMFDGMPTEFESQPFTALMKQASARWSAQEDRITAIDNCLVEPDRCLIIGPDGALVKQSLPHRLAPLFPSIVGYALKRTPTHIPEALVYDGFASQNFYHHLTECVASLLLFLEHGDRPADIPVIVARWIYDSPFFAGIRTRNPRLASLNWRVQEPGEWLQIGRAYRAHAIPFEPHWWREVRTLYGSLSQPRGRRIFLSRDKSRYSRGLHNEEAVEALLGRYGFEMLHFEHLTLAEQQCAMEESEYVVALHGMALIQQVFMNPAQARVLELMPASRLQTEYYWQGWTLGLRYYDVQVHSALAADGHYDADLERLEAAVKRMLAAPTDRRTYGMTEVPEGATAVPVEVP
ncbi:MAG: glycosyltransferase family 61 protein [Pseudomonadota bacterium]